MKINSEIKGRGVFRVHVPRKRKCSRNFAAITKFLPRKLKLANLERFTKFLCHENLELYGIYNVDILTIIINFPYSTCIRSFFGSSIPTSLFIF